MSFKKLVRLSFRPSQMLRELIPGDLLKTQNSAEWKRMIIAAYNQDTGGSSSYTRIRSWPACLSRLFCSPQAWPSKTRKSRSWRSSTGGRRSGRPSSKWNRPRSPTTRNYCWSPSTNTASASYIPKLRWTIGFRYVRLNKTRAVVFRRYWWRTRSREYRTGRRGTRTFTWRSATWSEGRNCCARRPWATKWTICWRRTYRWCCPTWTNNEQRNDEQTRARVVGT